MVKCPRGTPSQIRANIINLKKLEKPSVETNFSYGGEEEEISELSEEPDLDSNLADKRGYPTPQDDLVNFFVGFMLDTLLQSWDGKPCYKPKLSEPLESATSQSEDYGENDLLPCEYSSTLSTTADYLKDLYMRRSSTLERQYVYQKTKSGSVSNESDEFDHAANEEMGQPEILDPFKSPPDEEVNMVFLNGAWYKGRVSKRLMDGEGTYFWQDGTCYTGDFVGGWATGKGRIDFPCQSVYEGGVYKGFRHGEGMYCLNDSPVMYTGQWWLGKKHGEGLIVYNEPSKGPNFYRGQWQDGVKEGFGYRQYPSGAKYIGFWSNGKRHGKGVMLWANNDIYRGNWKEGLIHGYGEYTWNGFINKTLSYPATNTYRGYWTEGKRSGHGTFETINDGIINTSWEDDLKSGPGVVICANGTNVTSEYLFHADKQAPLDTNDDAIGLSLREQCRQNKSEKNLMTYVTNAMKARTISVPIHSSVCSINLGPIMEKFSRKREELLERDLKPCPQLPLGSIKGLLNNFSEVEDFEEEGPEACAERTVEEEKYLRNAIAMNLIKLKTIYNTYASLTCEKPPPFKCVLLRLFFWQMLIDCKIPTAQCSLIDIDEILFEDEYLLLQNPHDPFERIRLGQFISIVVTLSWFLYAQHVFSKNPLVYEDRVAKFLETYQTSQCKYVLKLAFNYFVDVDLTPENTVCSGQQGKNAFIESDLAPLEAMYAIYRKFGEPHSARVFFKKIFLDETDDSDDCPAEITIHENVHSFELDGTNALTVAGELAYIPGPTPFNFPEILPASEEAGKVGSRSTLAFCKGLSAPKIVECLSQSCPGLVSEGFCLNLNQRLTFLEFYNSIIKCTEMALRLNKIKAIRQDILEEHKRKKEEYEKFISEQERFKDLRAVSSKRSRQVLETTKTGKK